MKSIVFTISIFLSFVALAAPHGGGHGEEGIPASVVYHTINVFILFAGLIYFLKKPLALMFSSKKEQYLAAASKAEAERTKAEKENKEIKLRLSKLESTMNESLEKARADASSLKNQILNDAQAATKKLKEDAERSIQLELQRMQSELRQKMLAASVAAAREALSGHVGAAEQSRLENEFVEKIQVVRS